MAKEELYVVRRRFPFYGTIPGDTGLVMPLAGYVNDEKLIRLGFLEKLDGRRDLVECGTCGQRFLSGQYRDAHGDRQHNEKLDLDAIVAGASRDPGWNRYSETGIEGEIVPDLTGDAEERRLEREAPIHWEKTTASQRG